MVGEPTTVSHGSSPVRGAKMKYALNTLCTSSSVGRATDSEFGARDIIFTNYAFCTSCTYHLLASQYTLRVCKGPGFESLEVHQNGFLFLFRYN